jgi:Lectin C-type domain
LTHQNNYFSHNFTDWSWFWLSASDVKEPGQFHWTDGSAVNTSLWGENDPNEFGVGKVACVDFYVNTAKLYDENCSFADRQILCEARGSA